MEFKMRAHSTTFTTPVHTFEGDELVSRDEYRDCMATGYVSSVSTLYGAATKGFGLKIDTETLERWKRGGASSGLLDSFLDDSPDKQLAFELYNRGLAHAFDDEQDISLPPWTDSRLLPAVILLKNSVSDMPENRLDRLRASAKAIAGIAQKKSQCYDLKEYISLLLHEAWHTGILVHGSVSDDVRMQPRFPSFASWTDHALTFGIFADHARDLWADKRYGRTSINPSVRNAGKLAIRTFSPLHEMTHSKIRNRASRNAIFTRATFYL